MVIYNRRSGNLKTRLFNVIFTDSAEAKILAVLDYLGTIIEMWALALNSYTDVPDKLLYSCIKHPDLTVDSEKHLCDAILVWIARKTANIEGWSSNDLCAKVSVGNIITLISGNLDNVFLNSKRFSASLYSLLCYELPEFPKLREGSLYNEILIRVKILCTINHHTIFVFFFCQFQLVSGCCKLFCSSWQEFLD